MAKYKVRVLRTFEDCEEVDIEVEAATAEAAKLLAVELASNDPSQYEWDSGELGNSTYSADGVALIGG